MRLQHTVQVNLTQDIEGKRKLFSDAATAAKMDIRSYSHHVIGSINIATLETESLNFGDVTLVRGIYLELDQSAKVRLNGSTDIIQMNIASDATKAKLFLEAEITQVSIENPTANILNGVFVAWGDPI